MLISELEKDDKIVVYKDKDSKGIEFMGYVDFIDVSWQNEYNQASLKDHALNTYVIDDTDNFVHWQDHIESITESMSKLKEIPQAGQTYYFDNSRKIQATIQPGESIIAHDTVKHPAHYTYGDIEVIDYCDQVCKQYPPELAPYVFNAIKYLSRANMKNGQEDIAKAKFYVQRLFDKWED